MNRNDSHLFGTGFAVFCFLLACAPLRATDSPAKKPNFILFLADDLGWNGLGCYGSDLYETPHVDQLA